MVQDLELSDYTTIHELRPKRTETTSSDSKQSEKKLFRIGLLTLGLLCILQAALNISLRLAFHSKEDIEQLPFNSSVIADLCKQNSTQFCSCCNNLLKRLYRTYRAMEAERDRLQEIVHSQEYREFESGSGYELYYLVQTSETRALGFMYATAVSPLLGFLCHLVY